MADSTWRKVPRRKIPNWVDDVALKGTWDMVLRTEGRNYQYKIVFDTFANCQGQGHSPDYWVYSRKIIKHRKKGSAIVEYKDKGILVVAGKNKKFMLPGGGTNRKESRMSSAMRELKEETGITAIEAKYLFSRRGPKHKKTKGWWRNKERIYYVIAKGKPKPDKKEVHYIEYYTPGKNIDLMRGAEESINRYYKKKRMPGFLLWSLWKKKIKKQEIYSKF